MVTPVEPAPFEPKTIMFMSADIADATRFKETGQSYAKTAVWLEAFETFFRELPLVFMGQVAMVFAESDTVPDTCVWKVLGDEIIFRSCPRNATEALLLTEAFYRSLVSYDARFLERWPLRIRGCCWAARFPGRNIEIEIGEMEGSNGTDRDPYIDYLGPDVDVGFRISGHAAGGQVILSLNLAEALASLEDHQGMRFHHVGRAPMKGVFAGRPYPLIMISYEDCMPDLWRWEETQPPSLRAFLEDPPTNPDELIDLAEHIRNYLNRMAQLSLEPLTF